MKPELTIHINEQEQFEFILADDVSYDIRQTLIKGGFRLGEVTDPNTEQATRALIRDLPDDHS